jgi:uncharacterized protein (TIGR02058 family)
LKRYIVEWGTGVDIHGGDVTAAAKNAVKDALSHCCLCGISELVGLQDTRKMHVVVKIACPRPEDVDEQAILDMIPVGQAKLDEITFGGMTVTGMHNPDMGDGDQIVIAVAALTIFLDVLS